MAGLRNWVSEWVSECLEKMTEVGDRGFGRVIELLLSSLRYSLRQTLHLPA